MKKTLIALAVASAAVATGVNASEVYNQDGTTLSVGGRAEARMNLSDGDVSDDSRVRLNLSGKVAINDNFYGLGFYEAEYTTDDQDTDSDATNDDNIDHRYSYAGFGGAFGEITYGKNDGALGQITDFTDTLNAHSGSASKKLTTSDRQDNMLSYKGSFDNISVKVAHRFEDRITTGTGTSAVYSNNNYSGTSASIAWAIGDSGVSLGAGAAKETSTANEDTTQAILAASYTFNGVYLAALYSNANADTDANDRKGYELTASYNIDQATYFATYGKSELDSTDDVKYLTLEGEYKFKPNFKGYVSYNINMLDEADVGDAASQDDVTLGLRYDF